MDREFTIGGVTFNLKLTFLIVITTLVPMLDAYNHRIFDFKSYDRFFYYFIIPVLVIVLLFREPLGSYGFKFGNWREGLMWVIPICLALGVFLYFFARTPAMQEYYQARSQQDVGPILWHTMIELFAWEFVWRGLLLFGLARYLGPGPAIFLQAVPFAFMHLGKPEIETLSTIFGGAGFGFVAWRTESFVYPWLIHWFIAALTMIISIGAF